MYNRYVPQPDGSYRRRPVPDPTKHPAKPQEPPCPPPVQPPPPPPKPEHPPAPRRQPHRKESAVDGFLRQLLPKDFDTGDLIVILLLLLMAGDCEEDRNNAILTIALYFLM